MRSARGQATIDYVALVGVLAIVFGLALGLATQGAPGIVNAVAGQMRRALCLVGGGHCADPRPKPCTVASDRDQHHFAVSVLFVRIDHNRSVLRERMSDGTVRLTVARGWAGGLEAGAGATARVSVNGRPVGATDEVRASAQAAIGRAKVYVARDAREASAFMRAIRDGRTPGPVREVSYDGGLRGLAEAGLGNAWLEGMASNTLGVRRDRRTGETTVSLNPGASSFGALTTALGGPAAGSDRTATLSLTLGRRRRPTELSLSAAGSVGAGAALPMIFGTSARAGGSQGAMAGRRWELGARLDLRDPAVRAAWERVRRHPTSADAIRALGTVARRRAYLDARTYTTAGTASGAALGVSEGARLGAEYDHIIDRSRLLSASSRPPMGLWERRLDCVAA
jgi:hypothetical protein